jgi:hypothetical protein
MFVKLLDLCKHVNARSLELVFTYLKKYFKSERFLRVGEFYSEKNVGSRLLFYDQKRTHVKKYPYA